MWVGRDAQEDCRRKVTHVSASLGHTAVWALVQTPHWQAPLIEALQEQQRVGWMIQDSEPNSALQTGPLLLVLPHVGTVVLNSQFTDCSKSLSYGLCPEQGSLQETLHTVEELIHRFMNLWTSGHNSALLCVWVISPFATKNFCKSNLVFAVMEILEMSGNQV